MLQVDECVNAFAIPVCLPVLRYATLPAYKACPPTLNFKLVASLLLLLLLTFDRKYRTIGSMNRQ